VSVNVFERGDPALDQVLTWRCNAALWDALSISVGDPALDQVSALKCIAALWHELSISVYMY
jgi:hypothetical protein